MYFFFVLFPPPRNLKISFGIYSLKKKKNYKNTLRITKSSKIPFEFHNPKYLPRI